ncbi:glutamate racemase [Skermanella stibiiresistens SB22]|uniref:Glutamate racemase n=1 Tax=Skermanella stibiiresistens SB22 TaxID=1385369 RepID=W9GV80_9PROT|nr:glutamate racemase [Skermanella stibiiresistens]EWY37689.1 glutamate racemase [Skermanella stibiiresistens SB22]
MTFHDRPIGIFDSGVGGLTVLRALRERLPAERLLYLGDTARLPYGTKSPETIARYAVQAAGLLVERGIKLLVVACNTASAHALDALRDAYPQIEVTGVIEPGAEAACAASASGRIAVIATESTARAGAYQHAIHRIMPEADVTTQACSVFVALAEEGWLDGPVAEAAARRYLAPLFQDAPAGSKPDTLVLGCTHFPLLSPVLEAVVGPDVALVDSARTTADVVAVMLERAGVASRSEHAPAEIRLLATDAPDRFARVAANFLPFPITPAMVELVDLGPVPVRTVNKAFEDSPRRVGPSA